MTPAHQQLLQEFQDIAKTASTTDSLMDRIARRLHEKMARYNWVGFYLIDPTDPRVLLVGPFVGSFTPTPAFPSTPDSAAPLPPPGRPSWCTMLIKTRATSPAPRW